MGTSENGGVPAKRTRAPAKPRVAGLSGVEMGYLKRVASGEQIHASRIFPYAFAYKITGHFDTKKGAHVGAGEVGKGAVANLVAAKMLECPRVTSTTDYVIYEITALGREIAGGFVPALDSAPIDLFAEATS
jgi:hypothetical protein